MNASRTIQIAAAVSCALTLAGPVRAGTPPWFEGADAGVPAQSATPSAATSTNGGNGQGTTSNGQAATSGTPNGQVKPPEPPRVQPPVTRVGVFDLEMSVNALALLPELRACADKLSKTAGHADCELLTAPDEVYQRLQLAWEDSRPGGELLALRFLYDPAKAPPLTELEWQLTRAWGQPALEQLRRDRDQKIFTLQWEDAEHRATLEAAGPNNQPSRAVSLTLERKARPLAGELAGLKPRPFPNLRLKQVKRLDFDGVPWALVWGTSLTPAQEAMGETGPAWAAQRSYVGLWKLEVGKTSRRWRPQWERASGDEEDDPQRMWRVEARDVTGDSVPDVIVELACQTCGAAASEVLVKTVRAGKVVDLLGKRDLLRAQVDLNNVGQVRIQEAEGDDAVTVSTYAYDRSKGAFVLAREERKRGEGGR
ncbi:MAG: hypothetical protein JST92_16155 [Deltaproteobacteria bacterium]|nr:hypothetical protein [Deltaproteobacteria bacterium]